MERNSSDSQTYPFSSVFPYTFCLFVFLYSVESLSLYICALPFFFFFLHTQKLPPYLLCVLAMYARHVGELSIRTTPMFGWCAKVVILPWKPEHYKKRLQSCAVRSQPLQKIVFCLNSFFHIKSLVLNHGKQSRLQTLDKRISCPSEKVMYLCRRLCMHPWTIHWQFSHWIYHNLDCPVWSMVENSPPPFITARPLESNILEW